MSTIGPAGKDRIPASGQSDASLATSPLATQVPSQGSLLSKIQSEHRPSFTGFLGKIEAFFLNRAIKSQYLETLAKQFSEGAKAQGLSQKEAVQTFNRTFRSFLSDSKINDMAMFESLLTDPEGIKFCMENLTKFEKMDENGDPIGNINRERLAGAFALLPRSAKLMVGQLPPEHQREYLQAWILNSKELSPTDFKDLVSRYTQHVQNIEKLQSRRPEVFDQESSERKALAIEWAAIYAQSYPRQIQRISLYELAIRDTTVIDNMQLVMYAIGGLYLGPTNAKENVRAVPQLNSRISTGGGETGSFGLYNQVGIPFTLEGPDDAVIQQFPAGVEMFITDPSTMETRSIRVSPLPIDVPTTVGEARQQLQLMKAFADDMKTFDAKYTSLNFPEEKREAFREKFRAFDKEVGIAFGHAIGDLNSTPTRPKGTTAREEPLTSASIKNPKSQPLAIGAATVHNLYLLGDNTLSLLPSGPGENHRGVGALSRREIEKAQGLFLNNDSTSIPITMPKKVLGPLSTATLSIQSHVEYIDEKEHFLVTETKIEMDGETITRKSYYVVPKDKTADAVKKETIDSRLLERDLLLAKADFIEKHVK